MGYYTYYELEMKNADNVRLNENEAKKVWDWIDIHQPYVSQMFDGGDFDGPEYRCANDHFKWYHREKDMLALSREFPDYIFTLFGDGEESEDFWYMDFRDGMFKYRPVEFVYPTFEDTPWEKGGDA